ncbi:hypothetical protein HDU76_001170 [Blyttiomyces sp. JEL0837]|nr:hypothetical protein HDU76_001170 [Blyttiomyces sp. JEL0837]
MLSTVDHHINQNAAQAATSSSSSSRRQLIKQGWMLKRAGSGLLAQWRLKYMILCMIQVVPNSTAGKVVLQVYDQVDQSMPPKHEIFLHEAEIEVKEGEATVPTTAGMAGFGKKGICPFTIFTRHRKYHFAAQTKGEGEEWISILTNNVRTRGSRRMSPSRQLSRAGTVVTDMRRPSQPQFFNNNMPGTLSRSNTYRSFRDDDASSVYSVDSVVSSLAPSIMEAEDVRSCTSSFETLSFCSEPVLTPHELVIMGSNGFKMPAREESLRRRKVSIQPCGRQDAPLEPVEKWNVKYQRLLLRVSNSLEESMRQDVDLMNLIGCFDEAALTHAIKMVDEYHVGGSRHNKGAGIPGAVSIDGMILHFACDYDVATAEEVDAALCRTSSELRSINAFNGIASGLGTALMSLIDYKGFRVVAYADMGIDQTTIPVFDLHSKPIHVNDKISERLGGAAKSLNLKSHGVQIGDDRRVNVHLSASVEVHHDQQTKQNYAVNLHEIFPMDFHPPLSSTSSSPTRSGPPSPKKPSQSQPTQSQTLFSNGDNPNAARRLRPEFLAAYNVALSSDAFTTASGCGRRERELNDQEVVRASRFLNENWIPAFVRRLDELEIRPVDSRDLSVEMHKGGVNIRYLGMIAKISHLPYVRNFSCIEMVSRAAKVIFAARIRALTIHFRSVGATQIDEETKTWAANIFSTILGTGDKSEKFFEEKLRPEIAEKFDYDMEYSQFAHLHRPALFLALQYQCGVTFQDSMDYNFSSPTPCPRQKFLAFTPRRKHLNGSPKLLDPQPTTFNEDDRLAYHLSRHFRSLGPKSKLSKSDLTCIKLTQVASHYNATGRYEEARRYAAAAASSSPGNMCAVSLAKAQLVEALGALQVNPISGPDTSLLTIYRSAVSVSNWHWGVDHPVNMALHDRVCDVYLRGRNYGQALEFHNLSLGIAMNALGKNHVVTAGYLTKAGILLGHLKQTDESIRHLNEALHIYNSVNASPSLLAETLSHLADALDARGDLDSAIQHSQQAKKLREKAHGQLDPRSVASYLQLAGLIMKPYEGYKGVVTPAIRSVYRDAINCYEKVFRYVKMYTVKSSSSVGKAMSWSSSASVTSSSTHNHSTNSTSMSTTSTRTQPVGEGWPSQVVPKCLPISGPALTPPFAPLPPMPKSILLKLTRKIIGLKLALVESPRHKEIVRTLRVSVGAGGSKDLDGGSGRGSVNGSLTEGSSDATAYHGGFDPSLARDVVVKMAAVSPSIYLDGVLARIDDDDESAIDELAIALHLTENDTVGLAA